MLVCSVQIISSLVYSIFQLPCWCTMGIHQHPILSLFQAFSWGTVRKTVGKKIKKCLARGSKRPPAGKLNKKIVLSVPVLGIYLIPSDWSILTDFVNTQANLTVFFISLL